MITDFNTTEKNECLPGRKSRIEIEREKKGKEAIWKLLGCSLLTDGLAELREANAYVRNGRPLSLKERVGIRAIPQQMSTYTHTNINTGKERTAT